MAFFVDLVAHQTTLWSKWCPQLFSHASLLLSLCTAPSNVIRWWHTPTALTRCGVHTHQKFWNQVAFWMITWPWNTWAITSLIWRKTRGIFLQECSSPWVRRETSCKVILHLRSWETNGFVRQVALSTENCRKCTTFFRFCPMNGEKRWASKNSSSPEDAMIISNITGNVQGVMLDSEFHSYILLFPGWKQNETALKVDEWIRQGQADDWHSKTISLFGPIEGTVQLLQVAESNSDFF